MSFLPVILLIFLDIYAIVALWQEQASAKRSLFWLLIILFVPAIGALLYLLLFRREPPAA